MKRKEDLQLGELPASGVLHGVPRPKLKGNPAKETFHQGVLKINPVHSTNWTRLALGLISSLLCLLM